MAAQGTPVNIIVGSHVWLEDPGEAWVDGVVAEIKGGNATIATTNGKTVRTCLLLALSVLGKTKRDVCKASL